MKTNINNLIIMGAAVLLTACSSKDLFDENFVENNAKASYAENFATKYANVNMNQSWDYSHKQPNYRLGGGGASKSATRAAGDPFTYSEDYYTVDNNTLKWLNENLAEARNNKHLGNPFYMTAPGNDFTIIPIYQGNASAVWNLHVVVDGEDYKIWTKHQGMQVIPGYGDDWVDLSEVGNTLGAKNTRSKEIRFSGLPVGAEIYFYLEVPNGADGWMASGAMQSSLNHMMLALQDVPRPANIDPEKEVMIIGCEDADQHLSDWDMNDVVLLVYGDNKVPKPIEITNEHVEEVTTVRYMIEDLGATDDFDFNDIVLDVSNITEKTAVYENGKFKEWTDVSTRQEAVIRHLGGTLPFKLTIGNTELEEHAGVMGANPNERYEVSGWDMNRHNIKVEVRQVENTEVYNTIGFPKAGEAPMIIAVDPSQGWMDERLSVPESWFYVPEE